MAGTAYLARWVQVRTVNGTVPAITFVVHRAHARYAANVGDAEAAAYIATATGVLGSCFAYFENAMAHLSELGIRDGGLQRILTWIKRD